MLANYEHRIFEEGVRIWIELYCGLKNVSHWHMEEELLVCLKGKATLYVDDECYEMNAGECAFLGCGCIHSIESDKDCLLIVSQFENGCTKSGIAFCLRNPVFKDRYHAQERMKKVLYEYSEKERLYEKMIDSIIMELKIEILRGEEVVGREFAVPAYHGRYLGLLREIDKRFTTFSFSEAAEYMNMSEAYFSRFFKKATGLPFSRYLERVRVSRAVDLININHNIPVSSLLVETGFNTIRSFNRVFKSITGYSPKRLPKGFNMIERGFQSFGESFDPTLACSIPLRKNMKSYLI